MHDIGQSLLTAVALVAGFDPELIAIVTLSLRVSLSATLIAMLIGAPLGGLLAVSRFRGRQSIIVVASALLGLPPVVRAALGELSGRHVLHLQCATGESTAELAALAALWAEYGDAMRVDGAAKGRSVYELFVIGHSAMLTAFLAAFGRAIAEVGAIIVVGGNIRGLTRTMTTAIALETSKGDLALALGLGVILIVLSLIVSAAAFLLDSWSRRG